MITIKKTQVLKFVTLIDVKTNDPEEAIDMAYEHDTTLSIADGDEMDVKCTFPGEDSGLICVDENARSGEPFTPIGKLNIEHLLQSLSLMTALVDLKHGNLDEEVHQQVKLAKVRIDVAKKLINENQ